MMRPLLPVAKLNWGRDSHPVSAHYDDIYYSNESGIEESRHVFVINNRIRERLTDSKNKTGFTIAETGFGTGLNFLCSWLEWRDAHQSNEAPRPLHFVSVEKSPLSSGDLRKALSNWPQLAPLSHRLIDQYPPPVEGCHRLIFERGKVTLTLYFGDAEKQYRNALFLADAWYLDGFSPAKNPDIWTPTLFGIIRSRSAPQSTFSTFSAAGLIKRGMSDVGFDALRVPGIGLKREMIEGRLTVDPNHQGVNGQIATAWLRGGVGGTTQNPSAQYDAIVIGAGLAGVTTAHALAERGKKVLVVERSNGPAKGASGNPQGALYHKFSTEFNIQTQYALANLLFAHTYYQRIQKRIKPTIWSGCGLIQVACNKKEAAKQSELLDNNDYPESLFIHLTKEQASEKAGISLNHGGLYFPGSGWVAPQLLCHALLNHNNIETRYNTPISAIARDDGDRRWIALDENNDPVATGVSIVVCSAFEAKFFSQLNHLPTKSIRGQVSVASLATGFPLKTVLCGDGYISPENNGEFCFGATFDLLNKHCEVLDADHQKNIEQLTSWLHSASRALEADNLTSIRGRASLRCTSPDYLPIIGRAPIYRQQVERFAQLRNDAKSQIDQEGAYYEGLFTNIAHGSKGLSTCPLAAEFIASQICHEPSPLTQDLVKSISPSRFIIRNLIRGKI